MTRHTHARRLPAACRPRWHRWRWPAAWLSRRLPPARASDAPPARPRTPRPMAKADTKAVPKAAAPAGDNLDALRERLAEKLGAAKPPERRNPNVLRVTAKLEAPAPGRRP
jgi:hypothetical protein